MKQFQPGAPFKITKHPNCNTTYPVISKQHIVLLIYWKSTNRKWTWSGSSPHYHRDSNTVISSTFTLSESQNPLLECKTMHPMNTDEDSMLPTGEREKHNAPHEYCCSFGTVVGCMTNIMHPRNTDEYFKFWETQCDLTRAYIHRKRKKLFSVF